MRFAWDILNFRGVKIFSPRAVGTSRAGFSHGFPGPITGGGRWGVFNVLENRPGGNGLRLSGAGAVAGPLGLPPWGILGAGPLPDVASEPQWLDVDSD